MRVLVVAYACEPDRGSEPAVGWNIALGLARRFHVTVITRANNREAIRAAPIDPDLSIDFLYCDAPAWARFYKRGRRGVHPYLLVWQWSALRLARRAHARDPFAVVHHLTFSAAWYPSLFGMLGIPFVWGPLAANEPVPRRLERHLLSRRERLANRIRAVLNGRVGRCNPLLNLARDRADTLPVVNGFVAATLAERHRHKAPVVPAIGAGEIGSERKGAGHDGPLRVLMVGRLIGLKGTTLALAAIASMTPPERPVVRVVGAGPSLDELRRQAVERSIAEAVQFTGALSHEETMLQMRWADVLLFPAFDAGGMVVVEAMAYGLPIVALDTGGPSETVTAETGVLVPVGTARHIAEEIATALRMFAADPERRREMGDAGRRRFLERYRWSVRADELADLLAEVVAS